MAKILPFARVLLRSALVMSVAYGLTWLFIRIATMIALPPLLADALVLVVVMAIIWPLAKRVR